MPSGYVVPKLSSLDFIMNILIRPINNDGAQCEPVKKLMCICVIFKSEKGLVGKTPCKNYIFGKFMKNGAFVVFMACSESL